MSETAAILRVFISPALLLISILYSFTTGMIALINPPVMSRTDKVMVVKNDHFLKDRIDSGLISRKTFKTSSTISDKRNKKNPYSINASQNPPIMLRISVISEECLASMILAAMKRAARTKNVMEYRTLLPFRRGSALYPLKNM